MSNQEQQSLNLIESSIIDKMASAANVQPFQMLNMIKRCEELKSYYQQLREAVIREMAT